MNPETIKQVLDSLEKNGAVALDGIATNASMQAWGHIIMLIMLLVLVAGLITLTLWLWKKAKDANRNEEDMWCMSVTVSGVASIIFLIAFLVNTFDVPSNIATIKNPRAAAIRILLQR
jgi:4-amino-4-deoxy-L-arabinose transferase-like glycosyltransferase